ncbi:MAG TPA: LysR family transcriptional regulator [Pseudonocardia sp.]|jgi:DNA-binding transcriptional LysR family regulator|nr:LysR family transcriptional regulator [Pseudonocardia sp.]
MGLSNVPTVALKVFCQIAERRTLTAAARALGYTQSAVSRQVAALESAAGVTLLERRRDGVTLTAAGQVVLRHAMAVLDQVDATERELAGLPASAGTVRFGWFATAGATVVPRALAALRRTHPAVTVTSREGSTPVLVRALRAGSLDLALLGWSPPFRPFDAESPALHVETLTERDLCLALPESHPLAGEPSVDIVDLRGERWIAGSTSGEELLMGVWPGVGERPKVVHTARDWLSKLHLVAAGCGVTTVPVSLAAVAPPGVRFVTVRGGPQERRRTALARLPGHRSEQARALADAVRAAALDTG